MKGWMSGCVICCCKAKKRRSVSYTARPPPRDYHHSKERQRLIYCYALASRGNWFGYQQRHLSGQQTHDKGTLA